MLLVDLIVFILVLGVIILIHEFGHFYFAKRAKILCHEFAIGMGPAIWQKRKGETIYSIRSIPI
ncbi:MAG TPA: site-2 protease family protein, partial [Acholeplasmataceae bacterium]|nr:site-2 protease family protein [Acholeplasmataceae bacterium]